jgi:hypothetical protein
MEKAIVPLALLVTTAATATPAAASEPVCFMETASGQVLDLTKLCAQPTTISSRSIAPPEMMATNKLLPTQTRVSYSTKLAIRESCPQNVRLSHLCDGWVFQSPDSLRYYRSQGAAL